MSAVELAEPMEAIPPGVLARHRSSLAYPQSIPDLIGVRDRLYLDKTGLVQQRSIADLMRYVALNQQADNLSQFGQFIPAADDFRTRPGPETQGRASDEQLFALARYLYSLKPPENPNKSDALTAKGEAVFARVGLPPLPHAAAVHQQHADARRGLRGARQGTGRPTGSWTRRSTPTPS